MPTHILLKHSHERIKYKCPFKSQQVTCGKLFGQVKNFIAHYISKHNASRSVAKKIAGKSGGNLQKVLLTNKGKLSKVVDEEGLLGFTDDDIAKSEKVLDALRAQIEVILDVCIRNTDDMDENMDWFTTNVVAENSYDISIHEKEPSDLSITNEPENEEPLDLSIKKEREYEFNFNSKIRKRCLPLDSTVKKNNMDHHQSNQTHSEGICTILIITHCLGYFMSFFCSISTNIKKIYIQFIYIKFNIIFFKYFIYFRHSSLCDRS